MTVIQLLQSMGITALLLAVGMGIPVSVFLYLRRTPRLFRVWPIGFAAAAGALAPLFDVVLRLVLFYSRR